jgi:hypothetical protein
MKRAVVVLSQRRHCSFLRLPWEWLIRGRSPLMTML